MNDRDYNFDFSKAELYDVTINPHKYKWTYSFYFYGSRSKAMAHGYGEDWENAQLYEYLNDPFIERYFDNIFPTLDIKKQADAFIYQASEELFPFIEKVGFTEQEVRVLEKRLETNMTRYKRAEIRLLTIENSIKDIEKEIAYQYSRGKKTKAGVLKKSSRAYRITASLKEELSLLNEERKVLDKNWSRESSRVINSQERARKSADNARRMISSTVNTFSAKIKNEGSRLVKAIRNDIITRAQTGSLPLNIQRVSIRTLEERKRCHISSVTRFYASGQFINSIVINFKLEKR